MSSQPAPANAQVFADPSGRRAHRVIAVAAIAAISAAVWFCAIVLGATGNDVPSEVSGFSAQSARHGSVTHASPGAANSEQSAPVGGGIDHPILSSAV